MKCNKQSGWARPQAGFPNPQAGFTLIELMVGMAVGLLVTLAIAAVLVNAENQRRTTTTGSDAQINGGLAIYTIERQLKMAGYGVVSEVAATGCTFTVQYNGTPIVGAPAVLAPVIITAGADATKPDTVRVLSSSKLDFPMATPIIPTYYDPNQTASRQNQIIFVKSTLGIATGDLLALVYGGTDTTCEAFQATQVNPAGTTAFQVWRDDNAWNANKFPTKPATKDSFLVNLGTLNDLTYSLTADMRLRQSSFGLATQSATLVDLQSNVVMLKAMYGKDTNADGIVDTYNTTAPTNQAEWLQVRAVRVAIVARSAQYEKEEVTTANPLWDFGKDTVAGSATCNTDKNCVTLRIDGASDWKHYRYKVFELLVPLRNQLWKS